MKVLKKTGTIVISVYPACRKIRFHGTDIQCRRPDLYQKM